MVSNILNKELWSRARGILRASAREEVEARSLKIRQSGAEGPAIGVIEAVREFLHGISSEDEINYQLLETKLNTWAPDMLIHCKRTTATQSCLCYGDVDFFVLTPLVHSGRNVRYLPNKKSDPFYIDSDSIFVIPNFSSYWKVSSAGSTYQRFYNQNVRDREKHFVGTPGRLFCLLENLEDSLRTSITDLPPWRTSKMWKTSLMVINTSPSCDYLSTASSAD